MHSVRMVLTYTLLDSGEIHIRAAARLLIDRRGITIRDAETGAWESIGSRRLAAISVRFISTDESSPEFY